MRRLLPLILLLAASAAYGGLVFENPGTGLRPRLAEALRAGWDQGRFALRFGRPEGLHARLAVEPGRSSSVQVAAGDASLWSWPSSDDAR